MKITGYSNRNLKKKICKKPNRMFRSNKNFDRVRISLPDERNLI